MLRVYLRILVLCGIGAITSHRLAAGLTVAANAHLNLVLPSELFGELYGFDSVASTLSGGYESAVSLLDPQTNSGLASLANANAGSSAAILPNQDGTTTVVLNGNGNAHYVGGHGFVGFTSETMAYLGPNFSSGFIMVPEDRTYQISGTYNLSIGPISSASTQYEGAYVGAMLFEYPVPSLASHPVAATTLLQDGVFSWSPYTVVNGSFSQTFTLSANKPYFLEIGVGADGSVSALPSQSVPESGATVTLVAAGLVGIATLNGSRRRILVGHCSRIAR